MPVLLRGKREYYEKYNSENLPAAHRLLFHAMDKQEENSSGDLQCPDEIIPGHMDSDHRQCCKIHGAVRRHLLNSLLSVFICVSGIARMKYPRPAGTGRWWRTVSKLWLYYVDALVLIPTATASSPLMAAAWLNIPTVVVMGWAARLPLPGRHRRVSTGVAGWKAGRPQQRYRTLCLPGCGSCAGLSLPPIIMEFHGSAGYGLLESDHPFRDGSPLAGRSRNR